MALRKCPNCGKEISINSASCFYCGAEINAESNINSPQNSNAGNKNSQTIKKVVRNKKSLIAISIAIVLLLSWIIGINVHNAPMKKAMGYIDTMAKCQDAIDNETNRDLMALEITSFNASKSSLNRIKNELTERQLANVDAYLESKKLDDNNMGAFEDLKIETAGLSKDGDYAYFKGRIKNVGDSTYSNVKVKAIYYDRNKEVLTTDEIYAVGGEGIEPNETVQFDFMTKVDGDLKNARMQIMEWD
ncbi:FxLYD domain-containing protein [Aminipila terrae]|uniref:Zinc-ribbon domain-containing protein n=1 Tax=Aminipila terrae TaxID=2697030 RepID=A0A6P1MFJ5_9FIRM|nr:FxLYD domain-containing protein [Aminipila terrae]QHI72677.1 zinc-ribbon domain-containing protein [Aminipila terrae]